MTLCHAFSFFLKKDYTSDYMEHQPNSAQTNEQLANTISQRRGELKKLEIALNEKDRDLELFKNIPQGVTFTEAQNGVRLREISEINKQRALLNLRIVTVQNEITTLEKHLAEATYGLPNNNPQQLQQDPSLESYEKWLKAFDIARLKEEKEKLNNQLKTLTQKMQDDDSIQLLSPTFSKESEGKYKVAEIQAMVNVVDKLITQAERYDVNNVWQDIGKRG